MDVKQFFPILFWLIFILFSICQGKHVKRGAKKASYGSPCNSTVKCDIHAFLSCEDNVCDCLIYPDAMTYNHELGTCVSFANEVCGYLETKRVFINCVPNAYCDHQQGICKCSQGFVEASTGGNCIKQKGYGQSCHSDAEYLGELSLVCFEEICQCDSENYVRYDSESTLLSSPKTKCVRLAGRSCTAKSGCVPKATCVSESDNGALISSSMFGWLHPGNCECEKGYEMDEHGYCRGQYASKCDVLQNVSCLSKFSCLNGICQCKYPDDQIYHENHGVCMSLVGGPCTPTNYSESGSTQTPIEILCESFLECQNKTGSVWRCGCKQGFVENRDRGCDLIFGQPCTKTTMNKCDESAGLHCVDGKCSCRDELKIYNATMDRCVGKVGSSCKLPETTILSEFDRLKTGCSSSTRFANLHSYDSMICSENTECVVRHHLKGLTSHGICTQNINPVSDGELVDVDTGNLQPDNHKDEDDSNY